VGAATGEDGAAAASSSTYAMDASIGESDDQGTHMREPYRGRRVTDKLHIKQATVKEHFCFYFYIIDKSCNLETNFS